MESSRTTPAERAREAREAAARRRRTSVRLGTAGLVLLFAGGIGVILTPVNVAVLLGVMGIGIVFIGSALVLVQKPLAGLLEMPKE